ncbi:MAG: glycosyltransferase, partial [Chitinophagaceae bacterium]|nr:glycosyltransferase [Chitinophagaceae bacterium]
MLFSLIIPVYKRPKEEIDELLQSLSIQTYRSFEILIVEDFSPIPCESVVNIYKNMVDIQYFYKENSGPGPSRNYGSLRAKGDYFIFLDSDCIIPEKYLAEVQKSIADDYTDCFGGPDKAHPNFTDIQKAINYSMTSFFTTGGIRGGGEKLDTFYPRSFNMGYSRVVFEKTGGFANLPYGESEDIDMSIRIIKNGFRTKLIKTAFVYHKRRTNFVQFFKQTYRFGKSRVSLF